MPDGTLSVQNHSKLIRWALSQLHSFLTWLASLPRFPNDAPRSSFQSWPVKPAAFSAAFSGRGIQLRQIHQQTTNAEFNCDKNPEKIHFKFVYQIVIIDFSLSKARCFFEVKFELLNSSMFFITKWYVLLRNQALSKRCIKITDMNIESWMFHQRMRRSHIKHLSFRRCIACVYMYAQDVQ